MALVNVRYVTVSICEIARSGRLRPPGKRLIRIVLYAPSAPTLLSGPSRPEHPRPVVPHITYTARAPQVSDARLISSAPRVPGVIHPEPAGSPGVAAPLLLAPFLPTGMPDHDADTPSSADAGTPLLSGDAR